MPERELGRRTKAEKREAGEKKLSKPAETKGMKNTGKEGRAGNSLE